MGEFIVLSPKHGDRRVPWDPGDPTQIAEAHTKFNDLVRQGYRAYRVGRKGQPGERITEFDPEAGEILFTGKHGYAGG